PMAIVAIATSPEEPNVIYVATAANVYKSVNGGASFTLVGAVPAGTTIVSLDVVKFAGRYVVAIGNAATDNADVYTLDEAALLPAFVSAGFNAAYKTINDIPDIIPAVAFTPDQTAGLSIVAIGSDTDLSPKTWVGVRVGGMAWGGTIGNTLDALASTTTTGAIAFPAGFSIATNPNFFFGINDEVTALEGVYMFQGVAAPGNSVRTELKVGDGLNIVSLDVTGAFATATIIAGTNVGTVLRSVGVGGAQWVPEVTKKPSGATQTYVVIDYADPTKVFALVNGADGGFSLSLDTALNFNQLSLIWGRLGANDKINDLAVVNDNKIFLNTTDNATNVNSIWRWDGTYWERVFSSSVLAPAKMVEVSPDGTAVFAANIGGTAIYRSVNDGQSWTLQVTAVPEGIQSWVVIDSLRLITGDAAGNVYVTGNNGLSWTTVVTGAGEAITDLVLSPTFATDSKVLLGGSTNKVFLSSDGGLSWTTTGTTGLNDAAGTIDVAFDATDPNTIYATEDPGGKVVRRVGTGPWTQIDAQGQGDEFPVKLGVGMVSGADGTLYVADADFGIGMRRALDPTAKVSATLLTPYWEKANDGLKTTVNFIDVWLSKGSNKLWGVDATGADFGVYHYTDNLAAAPTLTLDIVTTTTATLTWTGLPGATDYQLQVNA
ncbi:MAG: hypothetical protein QMC90_04075, partial [Dehalococcoidales bacterium]|nr:hypothetical protein [Dehalococcoidales bacterium]